METIEFGIVTDWRFEHPSKENSPNDLTVEGIVKLDNDEHP